MQSVSDVCNLLAQLSDKERGSTRRSKRSRGGRAKSDGPIVLDRSDGPVVLDGVDDDETQKPKPMINSRANEPIALDGVDACTSKKKPKPAGQVSKETIEIDLSDSDGEEGMDVKSGTGTNDGPIDLTA